MDEGAIRHRGVIVAPPANGVQLAYASWRCSLAITITPGVSKRLRIVTFGSAVVLVVAGATCGAAIRDGTGEVLLLRCNGPHGGYNDSFDPDHPHWDFHVHRASAEMIEAGFRPEKAATGR